MLELGFNHCFNSVQVIKAQMLPSLGEAVLKVQTAASQLLGQHREQPGGQERASYHLHHGKEMERAVVLPSPMQDSWQCREIQGRPSQG